MSSHERDTGSIVLNPVSGDATHDKAVRDRAVLQGHTVVETTKEGEAITIARDLATNGESLIVAAGGDGTVNEVLQGIGQANAFGQVTVGIIPVGTGNNFAENIGISTITDGFTSLTAGDSHQIDLGYANDEVFVNSCIGGLTADASAATSHDLKQKFGILAYVMTTLRTATTFDGIHLSLSTGHGSNRTQAWTGEAICVFVGNGRRFPSHKRMQANMEDGLFDVTIIEDTPAFDLVGNTLDKWLFDMDPQHATQLQASDIKIAGQDEAPVNFSLDGEMVSSRSLSLEMKPQALRVLVGEEYEPTPDHDT